MIFKNFTKKDKFSFIVANIKYYSVFLAAAIKNSYFFSTNNSIVKAKIEYNNYSKSSFVR